MTQKQTTHIQSLVSQHFIGSPRASLFLKYVTHWRHQRPLDMAQRYLEILVISEVPMNLSGRLDHPQHIMHRPSHQHIGPVRNPMKGPAALQHCQEASPKVSMQYHMGCRGGVGEYHMGYRDGRVILNGYYNSKNKYQ